MVDQLITDCSYFKRYNYLKLDERDSGGQQSSYNFLISSKWMMIVARSQEKYVCSNGTNYHRYKNISINSVGFAGTILVKSEEDLMEVKKVGTTTILTEVAKKR